MENKKIYILTQLVENTEQYAESQVIMATTSLHDAHIKMQQLYYEKKMSCIKCSARIGTDRDIGSPYLDEMEAFIAIGDETGHERFILNITPILVDKSTDQEQESNIEEMIDYLIRFFKEMDWENDDLGRQQVRSIFTTICLLYHIDVDTQQANNILSMAWHALVESNGWNASEVSYEEYEAFERKMIELLC